MQNGSMASWFGRKVLGGYKMHALPTALTPMPWPPTTGEGRPQPAGRHHWRQGESQVPWQLEARVDNILYSVYCAPYAVYIYTVFVSPYGYQ